MFRFLAGAFSALLLVGAGFFILQSGAERENPIPPAPAAIQQSPLQLPAAAPVPEAAEKTREEKRFARADADEDGRIQREEVMAPRRKAFAKLDRNGDQRLDFEEWAVRTSERFGGADADRSGWLTAEEFATTRPKRAARPRCNC
jgi:hypothetical protein